MLLRPAICAVLLLTTATACGTRPEPQRGADNVVDIVARGLTFDAPDSIPAGWTTFRLVNQSDMVHFALIQRLPGGVGIAEQQRDVAPVFQQGYDLLISGRTDAAMAKFGELPEWFGDVDFVGGPGLVSAGGSTAVTMNLESGTYLIECYVKTNGIFHSYNPAPGAYGMVRELTVTAERAAAAAPEPTAEIAISRAGGMRVPASLEAGEHVIAVRFEDQVAHENFVGHDVHIARLASAADSARVVQWMDWTQREGLSTPAPVEFVGGLNEMPAGATGYIHVTLEPGSYAWVAEVPDPAAKGMFRSFTVGGAAD